MIHLKQRSHILKNQRGLLTLDFIFATLLMFTFSAILFVFCITFTAVNIAQYATFASARTYFAAHKNEDEQRSLAEAKFRTLVQNPDAPLGNMFRNNWFELSEFAISDFTSEFNEDASKDSDTFVGARVRLTAHVLQINVPLLGSTNSDDLSTYVSSYLMREPTEEECEQFVNQRFTNIQNLKAGFADGNVQPGTYLPIMDDGC
jgi:hypothetical protein